MKNLLGLITVALAAMTAPMANAALITTLYNTGVNNSSAVLANGTVGDPHYTLTTVPGGSTTVTRVITSADGFPIGPWVADNTVSRWIGPNNNADLTGPNGTYIYRTTFDLTGFDFTTAAIAGIWSKDDAGPSILINGSAVGVTLSPDASFTGFSAFTINGGFMAGINTLDFVVANTGGGPTGLRVEMTGTADLRAVPEPASLALTALALFGLGLSTRRRHS